MGEKALAVGDRRHCRFHAAFLDDEGHRRWNWMLAMPRPRFSIRTLLWLTLVVALGLALIIAAIRVAEREIQKSPSIVKPQERRQTDG
jgi:hypothetical protein